MRLYVLCLSVLRMLICFVGSVRSLSGPGLSSPVVLVLLYPQTAHPNMRSIHSCKCADTCSLSSASRFLRTKSRGDLAQGGSTTSLTWKEGRKEGRKEEERKEGMKKESKE